MSPQLKGGGDIGLGADPVGISVGIRIASFPYIIVDFDQICINTLLGEGKR